MAEYIKRDDAIREAVEAVDEWDGGYFTRRDNMIKTYLKDVPVADVRENVRGEWKEKIVDDPSDSCGLFRRRFYCTVCGNWQTYGRPNFCPNCGADMRGERNGEK